MTKAPLRTLEVTLMWNDSAQKTDFFDKIVRVGDEASAAFLLPAEVVPAPFTLAEYLDGAWHVQLPKVAAGELCVRNETVAVFQPDHTQGAATRSVTLRDDETLRVEFGAFAFFISTLERPQVAVRSRVLDRETMPFFAGSFAFHGAFLAAMFLLPPSAGALSLDRNFDEARRLLYASMPVETAPIEVPQTPSEESAGGKPSAGESGQAGEQTSAHHSHGGVHSRGPSADERIPMTREQAANSGILGVLRSALAEAAITNPNGDPFAMGSGDIDAYSALLGAPGVDFGFNGLGIRGTGRGGGCPPGANCTAGTVGIDGISTSSNLTRGMRQTGQLATRTSRVPNKVWGCSDASCTSIGGLAREQVRRTIQRHLGEVRSCYERELQARPDLRGRLVVQFLITPDGLPQNPTVTSGDIQNANVSACVEQAVRRWSFPTSPGMTVVSYPFVFESASNAE